MSGVDLQKFVQEAVDFAFYDSYPEFKVSDFTLPTRFRDRSESRNLSRSDTLIGTRCMSQAAILYDFDNDSHARIERATGRYRDGSELGLLSIKDAHDLAVAINDLQTTDDYGSVHTGILKTQAWKALGQAFQAR